MCHQLSSPVESSQCQCQCQSSRDLRAISVSVRSVLTVTPCMTDSILLLFLICCSSSVAEFCNESKMETKQVKGYNTLNTILLDCTQWNLWKYTILSDCTQYTLCKDTILSDCTQCTLCKDTILSDCTQYTMCKDTLLSDCTQCIIYIVTVLLCTNNALCSLWLQCTEHTIL